MQMESNRNIEERQFKWSLLKTNTGTIYHKSMERNLKGILKNILFKCKWNGFKMHFFLLGETIAHFVSLMFDRVMALD